MKLKPSMSIRCFTFASCIVILSYFSQSNNSETIAQEAAVCTKCYKRRSERRDIIGEIFETEVKYGRDLRIVLEEFHRPMLVAGLLTSDQLAGIFLNTDELIQVSDKREYFSDSKSRLEICHF